MISPLFLSGNMDVAVCQCVAKIGIRGVFPRNIFAFSNSLLSVLKKMA